MITTLTLGFAMLSPAHAAKCDAYLRKAETAQSQELVKAFNDLATCEKETAERNFTRFMTRATDSEVLTQLSLAAIENDIWTPVWSMPGKIKSYEARDIIAGGIGGACTENEKVVTFLQGAYAGLKDIDFQQWDDALLACESPELMTWMTGKIEDPPDRPFDAKFNTLMTVYTKKKGADALGSLQKGAIDAAQSGGPYNTILQQMNAAVTPTLGDI
ncbi:MAG: succinate dehydrogenase assembly factor 2, partial [Myxococcota bacterium]